MDTLENRKREIHKIVEQSANPRDEVHKAFKEKMKHLLLVYSGYVFALVEEKKHKMKESDLTKLTNEFVETTFKKAE